MLTKIAGKRYAYKFDFSALKLSCEAQQNPMPSDTKQEELHAIMAPFLPATPSSCPASAATSPAPLLSPPPPPADTETLPAFLEQGEVEVARSPPPPYPGYQPAATWAGPDLNTYTLAEAGAGSVAECEELALVSALLGPLDQHTVTPELPSYQDLAPATTWAGPDLNTYSYTTTSFSTTAEEFDLSFLAPGHQDGLHGYGGYQQRPASQ